MIALLLLLLLMADPVDVAAVGWPALVGALFVSLLPMLFGVVTEVWVELAAAISSLTHRRLCRFDVSSLMH